jgi:hypothetical protein
MAYRVEQESNGGTALIIDGFQSGIADNPYNGISDMRNVNIISIPGEASAQLSMTSATFGASSGSVVSADATADTVTTTGGTPLNMFAGNAVTFSGGSLPGGIVAGTIYWVFNPTSGGTVFQLKTTPDLSGTVLNITSTGTGTFSTTALMGKPTNRAFDRANINYFVIDANGRAWGRFGNSGPSTFNYLGNTTLTNANGNGIIFWKGYLFVWRNDKIDYMNLSTFAWTYGWQTLTKTSSTTNNSHYAHIGQDDTVYFCDGSFVGSILQKAGQTFDPTNAATYTFTETALALPTLDTAYCLAELGVNLMVGGLLNAIYPWDRTSVSFTYPILIAENKIIRMVTVNTNTYILAGDRGRIYITNGSQAVVWKKIPDHMTGTVEPYYLWGDLASSKNQLYFGISDFSSSGTALGQYGALWAIDLATNAIRISNKLSFGTYAGIASVILPVYAALGQVPSGVGVYVGWDSGASTYGMDASTSNPYTNGECTIDSDYIPIGTFLMPRQLQQIEYKLNQGLVAGESIKLQFRLLFNNASSGYSDIFTDNTTGAFSGVSAVNFGTAQWIQIRAVLTSTATNPSYVRLKELRLRQP